MTIRTRLTLWYAGALFVSLVLLAGLSYDELVVERLAERNSVPPEEQAHEEFLDEIRIVLIFGVPALLLSLAGGWLLTRKALEPVARLTDAAAQLHEGNLAARLPLRGGGDELDRLTGVFNEMTARLERSFQQVREFTLHASHELKTPLTVLRGEIETALREESLSAAQRERLSSQLEELQRLAQIVDGLTLLTRADAGQVQLKSDVIAFDALVRDSVEDARTLGDPKRLRVSLAECAGISVRGDRHRLRQLLLNLADNAVKYCPAEGEVVFELRRADGLAELRISNSGPGLAPEFQPRVFDRFFRGDSSHGRDADGCGLGLSIAQWIVRAHGGTIAFQSIPGERTTVSVRVPECPTHDESVICQTPAPR